MKTKFNDFKVNEGKYLIKHGLGGGFGGENEGEVEEFDTPEEAMRYAWEMACQDYESYEGMGGLRTQQEIMEEDELDQEDAEQQYNDERESWLEYSAEPYTGEKNED